MKRCDAGRIGITVDLAATCLADAGKILVELADNAMYKCQEEITVPNDLLIKLKNCSITMDEAINEFLLKTDMERSDVV